MKPLFIKQKPKINLAQYSKSKSESDQVQSGQAFENMTRLIEQKQKYMSEFESLTEKRNDIFTSLQKIARQDIPELAKTIGQMLFKLPDGTKIEITSKLEANPAKKNQGAVHQWLEKMGAGSIIKKQIVLEFDRTEQGQYDFEHAERSLREKGIEFAVKQTVNKATLEKHIRECREKGIAVDEKLLGVFDIYDTVINDIKTPKKS